MAANNKKKSKASPLTAAVMAAANKVETLRRAAKQARKALKRARKELKAAKSAARKQAKAASGAVKGRRKPAVRKGPARAVADREVVARKLPAKKISPALAELKVVSTVRAANQPGAPGMPTRQAA